MSRIAELLGGSTTLQRDVQTPLEAHDLLRAGLPGHALKHLVMTVGMLQAEAHGSLEKAVGISLRTYQRRKDAPDKPLSPEQSTRAWKFAEILGRTTSLLGSQPVAEAWLEKPAMALDGRKPIDLLSTAAGVKVAGWNTASIHDAVAARFGGRRVDILAIGPGGIRYHLE